MLTKNEITNVAFPNPTLEELIKQRNPIDKKPNVIKTAIFTNEKKLDLYLPLNIPKYKKEAEKRNLFDYSTIEKEKKLENIRNQLNNYSYKPSLYKKNVNKDDSLSKIINSIKENRYKLQEMEEKNKKNLEKLTKSKNPNVFKKPFNLENLIKEVKEIAKSVHFKNKFTKEEMKDKYIMSRKYRDHAIKSKKNSNTVEEFNDLEKSRDYLYLQKLVLNIEYRNVVRKKKKKKVYYTANNNEIDKEEFEKTNHIKNPIKLIKYLSPKQKMFERINTICSTENSITNSRINSAKKKSFCDEEDLLIQNSLFEKELLEKRNIKFYQKYKNCLNGIKREENKHYSNKVFNKDLIDLIMKSKNDLEIDKLKYDYNDKIGIIEANNQIILNKPNDNQSRNKHKTLNSVTDKMNTAYYNNEMGRLDSTNKYNIEDFIQL